MDINDMPLSRQTVTRRGEALAIDLKIKYAKMLKFLTLGFCYSPVFNAV